MLNKGIVAAHDCIDRIEELKLNKDELNICFSSLNGYYKQVTEQNEIINHYCFIIGKGGKKI